METKTLGFAIRRLREKRGMTAITLAEKVQLSEYSISRIENGHTRVDFIKMMDICKALSVSLDELLAEEEKIAKHLPLEKLDALVKARTHALNIRNELHKKLAAIEQD